MSIDGVVGCTTSYTSSPSSINRGRNRSHAAAHVHHRPRTVGVDHLEILAVLGGEMPLEDGRRDHRPALVAEIVAGMGEIDQPAGRLQCPPLHLVEELESGLHDLQVHRAVVDQVHQHLFHAAAPGDAVDEVHVAGRADADGQAPLVQRLGLPADGRVVEPVGRGEVGAVEVFQAVDAGERQIAGFQVAARLELGVLVALAEIALDAAVGKRLQLRAAVDRLDVAEIVAHARKQLLQVRQPEMLHEHPVHLGRAFVLDRDAVVTATLEGTEDTLAGVHGEVLWAGSGHAHSFSLMVPHWLSMSKTRILMPISGIVGQVLCVQAGCEGNRLLAGKVWFDAMEWRKYGQIRGVPPRQAGCLCGTSDMEFFLYFPISTRDRLWGMFVTGVGSTHVPPYARSYRLKCGASGITIL